MEQKEPSMEEILSSIRRILSHEEEATTQTEEDLKTTVSASALESAKDDVMELTDQLRVEEQKEADYSRAVRCRGDSYSASDRHIRLGRQRLRGRLRPFRPREEYRYRLGKRRHARAQDPYGQLRKADRR